MIIKVFDIETSPNLADVWGLWQQNVGLPQLHESGHIMCWAAKEIGNPDIEFMSEYHDGYEEMIAGLHAMMDSADVLVAHNGDGYDVKWANAEFLRHGLAPPDPSKTIDTLKVARQRFKLPSYKLDYLVQELGLGKKIDHEGHTLWTKCLHGDEKAWNKMRKYNIHDVTILQRLYYKLRPWIKNHPNHGLLSDSSRPVCTNCGSTKVHKKGLSYTNVGIYQRYRCADCGTPLRGRTSELSSARKNYVLTQDK